MTGVQTCALPICGDVRNAISSHTRIEGTLRCLDIETFDLIIAKMNEIADIYNDAYSCSIYVTHTKGYPPVTNNYRLFSKASSIFSDLGFRELEKPSMIADDFAFYQQEVPGLFMYLGTGSGIPLHSADFNFDESILLTGIEAYRRLLKI